VNLDGRNFLDVGFGIGVNSTSDGRSFVAFDFDHDGDQDIVISSTNAPAQLFVNRWADRIQNHWLKLRLVDGRGDEVPGAVVKVHTGERVQAKTSSFGNGYLSSYVGPMLFGLGKATRVDLIEVLWPGGLSSRLENVRTDQEIELRQTVSPSH
jgi:hypothetical protein